MKQEIIPRSHRTVWLYLIEEDGTDLVKVGIAVDPMERLSRLQTANPRQLSLCDVAPIPAYCEKIVHEIFSEYHVNGEWFRCAYGLREFMFTLAEEFDFSDDPSWVATEEFIRDRAKHALDWFEWSALHDHVDLEEYPDPTREAACNAGYKDRELTPAALATILERRVARRAPRTFEMENGDG